MQKKIVGKFKLKSNVLLRQSGTGSVDPGIPHSAFDENPEEVKIADHATLADSHTVCISLDESVSWAAGNAEEITSSSEGSVLKFESPSTA